MARTWFLRYEHSSLQRLGALKTLVALLDEQRRSLPSERLDQAILNLLLAHPEEISRSGRLAIARPRPIRTASKDGEKRQFPRNLAERLLADMEAPSLLFMVPEPKVSRIREWGRQLGFVGSGNQITERGLLLQHFMGAEQISAIRKARLFDYNPFRLSFEERLYFLYVLLERDGIWPFLLRRLAELAEDHVISGLEADTLTCRALLDLLEGPSSGLSGSEMLRRREVRHLALYMAESLGVTVAGVSVPKVRRLTRVRRPEQRARVRTNTADDQAIPRFENLVDLAFLAKERNDERTSGVDQESVKRRLEWRYVVAPQLIRWVAAAGEEASYNDQFLWYRFATCAAAAIGTGRWVELNPARRPVEVVQLLLDSYRAVRRPFGHTPFESVALTAMIKGLTKGFICEMASMHDLILQFKRDDLFSGELKFASGNDLDKMFIDMRPELIERVRSHHGS